MGEVVTLPTDWKSLAEEAAMDLDECPVEGCTGKPRHRGRHNKRGLLPETRDELDQAVKKRRGTKPGQVISRPAPGSIIPVPADWSEPVILPGPEPGRPEVSKDIPLSPKTRAELDQAIKPRQPLPDGRYREPLQRRVEAFYGVGNDTRGRGKVIAYCDAPQVLIEYEDGRLEWWRRDLIRDVTCPACNGTGMKSS